MVDKIGFMQSTATGKRIAKNTIMLYIRMLLTMAVSLYSSRIILRTLGVEDYGIYNVVGGVVAMFGFLNTSMVASTQRFMSYSLGHEESSQVSKVFSNSLLIHILIAFIILVFSETIGLWFFYNKLVIPDERMNAAFWVYQLSIVAFILNVIRVPDNSAIIAYEKMSAYAYFSIVEVVLKLAIVFILPVLSYDKLIVYAILVTLVTLLVNLVYRLYVNRNFSHIYFRPQYENGLFKEMASFAGWSLWGNLSSSLSSYGLNIVLNMFFGPIVNAARGIAYQVQSAIVSFGSSFLVAVNPQIIKSYAQEDYDYMAKLVFRASRLAFFLLFIMALPIINNREYILNLWLGEYPEYTSVFVLLILIDSLINILSGPIQTAINATGRIKYYQIVVGGILLANLPIAYMLLKFGANVYMPFIATIILTLIAMVVRLVVFKRQTGISYGKFYTNVLPRTIAVVIMSCLFTQYCGFTNALTFSHLVLNVGITLIVVAIAIFFVGLEKDEREWVVSKLNSILKRK